MARYLITGGCGFIGSHLSSALSKQGDEITILDNLSSGKRENAPSCSELIVGDIRDKVALKRALEGIDGCFHLAAIASMEKSITHWDDAHETNMLGSVRLLEAIIESGKCTPVIFASSAAVYGQPQNLPLKETSREVPLSPYGLDKLHFEKHLSLALMHYGIPSYSFRFFNVYGPRQDPRSPYSGVISIIADKCLKGEEFTIFGDGEQRRDFIYVGDVVRCLIKAMECDKKTADSFNLCTGRGISINELLELFEKIHRVKIKKMHKAPRKGDILQSIGDGTKVEEFFGFKALVPIEQGLQCITEDRQ